MSAIGDAFWMFFWVLVFVLSVVLMAAMVALAVFCFTPVGWLVGVWIGYKIWGAGGGGG